MHCKGKINKLDQKMIWQDKQKNIVDFSSKALNDLYFNYVFKGIFFKCLDDFYSSVTFKKIHKLLKIIIKLSKS